MRSLAMLALLAATLGAGFDLDEAVTNTPALVVAVRHRDGRHEVRAYGHLDDGKPPDGDTVFNLASVTKTFTALLYARGVAEHRYQPSTTVGALLGVPSSSAASAITLEQLATHTSGLSRLPPNLPNTPSDPYGRYTPELLLEALRSTSLEGVGEVHYSNFGFGVLGYAITHPRGGFAKALAEDVTGPLQLAHTTAFEPAPGARAASPHDKAGKPTSTWHKTEALIGAGEVFSSANDLLALSDALLTRDAKRPPALEAALVDVFRKRVDAAKPLLGAKRPSVALAWHIRDDGVRWQNGGTNGVSTVIDVDTASGCAAVVLAASGDYDVDRLVNRLLERCIAER